MNWPFIFLWLLVFAGIILAWSLISYWIFNVITYGVIIGVVCDVIIIIYCLVKTPWH